MLNTNLQSIANYENTELFHFNTVRCKAVWPAPNNQAPSLKQQIMQLMSDRFFNFVFFHVITNIYKTPFILFVIRKSMLLTTMVVTSQI